MPPEWERPALLGLLALTAALYLWDLTASGWANSFYSAAAQAGSVNWEAFFYGSSDAGNSITVDKPPASLWLMALSVRMFGLSSFSILLPEALMGVATVGVLYATLRRRFSAGTALLGGAVLALTPVAALMFRFNNPDALLVLLIALAAYFTLRAIDDGKLRWMLWAGVMVGLGFLTKQLQVLLIVPPIALAFLWASPLTIGKRLLHGLAALGAMVVSAGWWVAIVELVPASMRPYIGGSQTNSFLELTFGYNGFGRLTGNEVGSVTGGGGNPNGTSMWGATGLFRLFENEIGGQITWLLPAALVLALVGYLLIGRAPRTSPQRATLTLFAGWMLVTAVAFSFMAGIFHAYYTVALAPAIAAVVAIGASLLWTRRAAMPARIVMAALVLVTAGWAWALLSEASSWLPGLKVIVVILAVIGALLLLLAAAHAVDVGGHGVRLAGRGSAGARGVHDRDGDDRTQRVHRHGGADGRGQRLRRRSRPGRRWRRWRLPRSAGRHRHAGRNTPDRRLRRCAGRCCGWCARRRPRRGPGGPRWTWRSARCIVGEQRAGHCDQQRLVVVHLGRRGDRFEHRGRLPVGDRPGGDAARRLQRQRSVSDARPVREAGSRAPHPLVHRRFGGRLERRLGGCFVDRHLGRGALHRDHRRWRHAVRPERERDRQLTSAGADIVASMPRRVAGTGHGPRPRHCQDENRDHHR